MPTRTTEYSIIRPIIGVGVIAGGLLLLTLLLYVDLPESTLQPLNIGLGIVLSWGSQVVQSLFGSSTAERRITTAAADKIAG